MIINGVKWACDACIRGHRVSGCTHSDRNLKQIAKKGRPVSQCPHCRHLRKSRSAHVKCECGGEKLGLKDIAKKCPEKSAAERKNSLSGPCMCCHGGRCICAMKKDTSSLDPVPEVPNELYKTNNENRRPRLQSTQSESSLTTFLNGHHKPPQRHHWASKAASPYPIPGHTEISTRHSYMQSEGIQSKALASHSSMASKSRRIKSEQSSPNLLSLATMQPATIVSDFSPLDLNGNNASRQMPSRLPLSVNTNHSSFAPNEYSNQDYLLSAGSESNQYSAEFTPSLSSGWPSYTHFDPSVSALDWFYPGLTSSSSGDDIDDLASVRTSREMAKSMAPSASDASDMADSENYHLSAASSYIGLPQIGNFLATSSESNFDSFIHDYQNREEKPSITRYLADQSPQQQAFPDNNLSLVIDDGYEDVGFLSNSAFLDPSSDELNILASSVQSPEDSKMGYNTQSHIIEDDLVWMRRWSIPSPPQQPPQQQQRVFQTPKESN